MTFEQLIATARDWQRTLPLDEVRGKIADACATITLDALPLPGVTIDTDALLAFAASGKPVEEQDVGGLLRWPRPQPQPQRGPGRRPTRASAQPHPIIDAAPPPVCAAASPSEPPPCPPTPPDRRRRKRGGVEGVPARARALVRAPLANGPKPGEHVLAAAAAASIPKRSLIIAADALGVRTQRGRWWLPGS